MDYDDERRIKILESKVDDLERKVRSNDANWFWWMVIALSLLSWYHSSIEPRLLPKPKTVQHVEIQRVEK